MSTPVQQHYIPRMYLKYFVAPEKKDSVWMYMRNKEPRLSNIRSVATQRHLYSYLEADGKYNTDTESKLAEVESVVSESLEKLNSAENNIIISEQEKTKIAYFLALQAVRLPSSQKFFERYFTDYKKIVQHLASDESVFNKERPRLIEKYGLHKASYINFEYIQQLSSAIDDFDVGDKKTSLDGNIGLANNTLYPAFLAKDMTILKSERIKFITSDSPIAYIPHDMNKIDIGTCDIHFPISHNKALFFVEKNPSKLGKDQNLYAITNIEPTYARTMNKKIISDARMFLFGSECDEKIKELFDKT